MNTCRQTARGQLFYHLLSHSPGPCRADGHWRVSKLASGASRPDERAVVRELAFRWQQGRANEFPWQANSLASFI